MGALTNHSRGVAPTYGKVTSACAAAATAFQQVLFTLGTSSRLISRIQVTSGVEAHTLSILNRPGRLESWRTLSAALAFALAFTALVAPPARAAADGTIDTAFTTNTGTGADAPIYRGVTQTDGKMILVGEFTNWGTTPVGRIVRLNADGTLDTTFTTGTGANNIVLSVMVQANGQIFVGGSFTTWNGVTVNGIARLNSDGTIDPSFTTTGTGPAGRPRTFLEQGGGKVLVGGDFEFWNGVLVNGLVRLNADGTIDPSFTASGASDSTYALVRQSDGKILVGGEFSQWNGVAVGHLVRLSADGTLDTTFTTGTGADSSVPTIALQADGKILVGGYFANWNGVAAGRIVRLNADGTLDTTFTTGTGADGGISTVVVQADGRILVGGYLTTWNTAAVGRIVRLNADGTLDTTFTTGPGANSYVYPVLVQSDGKIVIGGGFTTWDTTNVVGRIVRLNGTAPSGSGGGSSSSGSGGGSTVAPAPVRAPESLPPVGPVVPVSPVAVGGSAAMVNGVPVRTTFSVNPTGGVVVEANGAKVGMAAVGAGGSALPASGGGLGSSAGGDVGMQASGFLPRSQVDVYLYSDPLWLGSAVVDAAGTVTMTVRVPAWVQPGSHTLQFVGYQGESTALALSTGIEVSSRASTPADTAQGPASSRAVVSFLPGASTLGRSAKATAWTSVNRVRSGSAAASVACTVTYRPRAGSQAVMLWQQRLAGINAFLTRAGCGTIIIATASLTGVTGPLGQTVRVTAATG